METQSLENYKIPFINTKVATDILLMFILLPLWWVLGIDQIIWPFLTTWIFVKLLFTSGVRIVLTKTSKLMIVLASTALISMCFIEENYRFMTFARNYSAMFSVLLMIVILTNSINQERQVRYLMWGLAILSFFISLMGVLAITHIYNPGFEAPSKYLIPEGLKSYGLVRVLYIKGTSTIDYFAGMLIVRPSSFFISCTSYGMVLIILMPIIYFLAATTRGLKKVFLIMTLVMLTVNLFFNITRGAMLSLAIAIMISRFRSFKTVNKYFCAILILFSVSAMFLQPSYFFKARNSAQNMINLRGPGSQESRQNIYMATLKGITERPIFGFGTQRDIPEISSYPAGSHSGYLGVLYRYGFVGFFIYIMILYTIYKKIRVPKTYNPTGPFLQKGINFLGIAFYGNILHQITEEPDLDAAAFHIVWLCFGLILVMNKLMVNSIGEKNGKN